MQGFPEFREELFEVTGWDFRAARSIRGGRFVENLALYLAQQTLRSTAAHGRMTSERNRQIEFLMRLLALAECRGEGNLRVRIRQAQHDEKCIRFALTLVALVGGFATAGLGYCAVLHPDFLDNASPTLVKVCCAVVLGSIICMLVFLGCWLWYRHTSNRLYEECRCVVMDTIEGRLKEHPASPFVQTLDFSLPVSTKQAPSSAIG